MIVHQLANYYDQLLTHELVPPYGWERQQAYLRLVIDKEGNLIHILKCVKEETVGKRLVERPYTFCVPLKKVRSGSKPIPHFLCDNAKYILGIDKEKTAPEHFDSERDFHIQILESVQDDAAQAVCNFFKKWNPQEGLQHPEVEAQRKEIDAGRNIVFSIEEKEYAHENPAIVQAWNESFQSIQNEEKGLCIITGKKEPFARIHGKIRGVPGAQQAGASLISSNAEAFRSYNVDVDKMPGAPIGETAAFAYVTALNYLISQRDKRKSIGESLILYWSEKADQKAERIGQLLLFPTDEDSDTLLDDVFSRIIQGKPIEEVDVRDRFFVLGITPNAARLAISFFYDNTFGHFIHNSYQHFKRLEIVHADYEPDYLSPQKIMAETVRSESSENKPSPQLTAALLLAMLQNRPYPRALYQAMLERAKRDTDNSKKGRKKISYVKAATIKACLYFYLQPNDREVLSVAVNKETTNKAYVLGRLFSILEQAQQDASPGIQATIKDRLFNSACANPKVAFPQLLKLSNAHTAKGKYGEYYEKKKGELLNKLQANDNPFPAFLSLEEQGLFILGYYQENQARYTKKEEQ